MNPQSIECDCGCWNIVVKVVPPGEQCPCGDPKPHDTCRAFPKKRPCDGTVMEEAPKTKYNVFQFERCEQCGILHFVDPDNECPAAKEAKKLATPSCSTGGGARARSGGGCSNSPPPWPFGTTKTSSVGMVPRAVRKGCH